MSGQSSIAVKKRGVLKIPRVSQENEFCFCVMLHHGRDREGIETSPQSVNGPDIVGGFVLMKRYTTPHHTRY